MSQLETALKKASEDPNLDRLIKEISADLVKVYMRIAAEFQEQLDFESALLNFNKSLDVAKRAQNEDIEAECYQKIGLIYHQLGHFDDAIKFTNDFLKLSEASNPKGKEE